MKKSYIILGVFCILGLGYVMKSSNLATVGKPQEITTKTKGSLGKLNPGTSTNLHLIDADWRKKNSPNLKNLGISTEPLSLKGKNFLEEIRKHLINSDPNKNISFLDDLSSKILDDESLPRQEKMKIFWDLIQEFGLNTDVGSYMLDTLSELRPMEYLSAIIRLVEDASPQLQKQLTITIAKMFTIDPSDIEGDMEKVRAFEAKRTEARKFFEKEFADVREKDALMNLLTFYPGLMTTDQGLPSAISASLERNKDLLTPEEYARSKLNLLSAQREEVSNLREFLMNLTSPEYTKGVNEQLYTELAGSTAEVYTANQSDGWRSTVREYLASQKPVSDGRDVSLWAEEYGKWANATINLSDTGASYSEKLMAFLEQASAMEQIALLDRIIKGQVPIPPETIDAIKNKNYINKIGSDTSLSPNDLLLVRSLLPTVDVFKR